MGLWARLRLIGGLTVTVYAITAPPPYSGLWLIGVILILSALWPAFSDPKELG